MVKLEVHDRDGWCSQYHRRCHRSEDKHNKTQLQLVLWSIWQTQEKIILDLSKKKEALWPCQHISALKRRRSRFVPVSLETWTRGMSLVVWKVAKSKCYLSNLLEMETDVQSNQSVFYMGAQSHCFHKQLQAIWFAFEYLYRLNSTYLNINAGTTRDYNTREWKIRAATGVSSIISNMDGPYGSEKWSRCSGALNLHSF